MQTANHIRYNEASLNVGFVFPALKTNAIDTTGNVDLTIKRNDSLTATVDASGITIPNGKQIVCDQISSNTGQDLSLENDGTAAITAGATTVDIEDLVVKTNALADDAAVFGTDRVTFGNSVPKLILPYKDYRDVFFSVRTEDWTFYGWELTSKENLVLYDDWTTTYTNISEAGSANKGTDTFDNLTGGSALISQTLNWPQRFLASTAETIYQLGGNGATYTNFTPNVDTTNDGGEMYEFTWPFETALVRFTGTAAEHYFLYVNDELVYQNGGNGTIQFVVEAMVFNGQKVAMGWAEASPGAENGFFVIGNGLLLEAASGTRYVYARDGTELESI